jgi:hypothetical protein
MIPMNEVATTEVWPGVSRPRLRHHPVTAGGSAAIRELSAVIHPVHRLHQQARSPRAEERLESGRHDLAGLIEISFAKRLESRHRFLPQLNDSGEQLAVGRITSPARLGR